MSESKSSVSARGLVSFMMLVALVDPFAARSLAGDATCRPREIQKIVNPAAAANDMFGLAVALLGEQLIVAAPVNDEAADNAGAVYAFELVGDTWTLVQQIMPTEPTASLRFGWSLAVDPDQPDLLVIGSPGDSNIALHRGSAYVFTRRGSGPWTEAQKLEPSVLDAGGFFGATIVVEGETIVVAAPFESNDVASVGGSAFVFERAGSFLTWTETQKLLPQEFVTPSGAAFGLGLDIEGSLIAVGAPYIGLEHLPGAVEVFVHDASGWTQEDRFLSEIFTGRDRFGSSLVFMGEALVIGAPRMPPPPNGLVHTFARHVTQSGAEWGSLDYFLADEPTYNDQFGGAVAIDGETLIAGAQNQDTTGAAFLYSIDGPNNVIFEHMITASDAQELDLFGQVVAIAGDLVAIGASNEDEAAPDAGAVYLFELDALPATDLDGDGTVGFSDLTMLLLAWGECPEPPALCPADVTHDGVVGFADLTSLLVTWGPCERG